MADKKGVAQYEVEATKRGRRYGIDLWIALTRGARGKKKLTGEAYTKNTEIPAISFKIPEGKDEGEILITFVKLLVHRGYLPVRQRFRVHGDAPWEDWEAINIDNIDGSEKVREMEEKAES